jgi:adenylylsulfate kinase
MTPSPTYSEDERERVYATAVYIARTLNENGVNVILDATGNLKKYRDLARRELQKIAMVYARCPLEVCIMRERKRRQSYNAPLDIYQKGLNGRSTTVPGLNVPYEEPLDAEVVVDSNLFGASECADKIMAQLWNCFF